MDAAPPLLAPRPLADSDANLRRSSPAQQLEPYRLSDCLRIECRLHISRIRQRLSIKRQHNVTHQQSAALGRPFRYNLHHQQSQPVLALQADWLKSSAEIAL